MNADCPIRGPYPLLVTPWTEDARLDIDILVREAEYVAGCGVNGLIWPPASEVMGTLSAEEYEAGLRALAEWVAGAASPRVVAVCPGHDSAKV